MSKDQSLVDRLIEKGKATLEKAGELPEHKEPLSKLRVEMALYHRVHRYLCPIGNYVPEYLVQMKWDPEYTVRQHQDYPNSSLFRGHISDFFEARTSLEQSILQGKHFTYEKKELLELFKAYELAYIAGNPIKLTSMETIEAHQKQAQHMMGKTQHILEGYKTMERNLEKPYQESLEAVGLVAGGVLATGVALIFGAIYVGGTLARSALAKLVLKEGAKKTVGL